MQTIGEQIGLHLGIDSTINAVIQKAINYAHPTYRVIINSRYPYRSILHSEIKRADSLKSGTYSVTGKFFKHFKFTPPFDLKSFNSPISSNAIIMFADLAVEQYLDPTLYECKGSDDKVLLKEFTIEDFKKDNISSITKYWSQERRSVAGQDSSITKVADFIEPGIFVFLTEPTYEFSMPNIENGKSASDPESNPKSKLYTLKIQIDKFDEWIPDPLNITFKEFKEVLKVADIKMDDSDISFHWQGFRQRLTQIDSAIYPNKNKDSGKWDKIHSGGLLNKHLYWLLHYINFHIPSMYRIMKDYYLRNYGQAVHPYKPSKLKIKKRSGKDIVPRSKG